MRRLLLAIPLLFLVSCGGDSDVYTPDHKGQIDDNTARVELLELKDAAQDLRLDSLESSVFSLESRMSIAEQDIIDNALETIRLTDNLSDDINDLNRHIHRHIRDLERADRNNKRFLLGKIRDLSRHIHRHIRDLEDADADLERDINRLSRRLYVLDRSFNSFRRSVDRRFFFLGISLAYTYNQIDNRLDALEDGVSVNASDIAALQSQVVSLQSEMNAANSAVSALQSELLVVESKIVSVVYPCGGSSGEVLLQTQDGLVGYFQNYQTKTINFSDSVTVDAYTVPGHYEKYGCGYHNHYDCTRYVGQHTIPAQTYNVGDSASIQIIKDAYLSLLPDGNYGTTDGQSCSFSISNGEISGPSTGGGE